MTTLLLEIMHDHCGYIQRLLTSCRALTSLTRDENFGPNMNITSKTRE